MAASKKKAAKKISGNRRAKKVSGPPADLIMRATGKAAPEAEPDKESKPPSSDYAKSMFTSLQFEAAMLDYDPDSKWDYSGDYTMPDDSEGTFYWRKAGLKGFASVLDDITELTEAKAGDAAVIVPMLAKFIFHRCVDPETGERLFTDETWLDLFQNDKRYMGLCLALGTDIMNSDKDNQKTFNAKVRGAEKN